VPTPLFRQSIRPVPRGLTEASMVLVWLLRKWMIGAGRQHLHAARRTFRDNLDLGDALVGDQP
jgi:hypothetical protein